MIVELAYAQKDRYVIFFKDKAASSFSISNPSAFLSERAIQRRTNQNISIEENDLPVNTTYIEQVAALGIETYYTTKWLNGKLNWPGTLTL